MCPIPHYQENETAHETILCSRFGGPDDLAYTNIPTRRRGGRSGGGGEIAALNFFDTLIIPAISSQARFRSRRLGVRRHRGERRPGREGLAPAIACSLWHYGAARGRSRSTHSVW